MWPGYGGQPPPGAPGVPVPMGVPAGGQVPMPVPGQGMTPEQYQQHLAWFQYMQQMQAHQAQAHAHQVQAAAQQVDSALPASASPPKKAVREEEEAEEQEAKLKVISDPSMNMEAKLLQNIQQDYYYTNTLAKLSTFEELCEEVASGDDGDPLFVNAWGGMRGIYKRADNMVVGKRRAECNEHENRSPSKLWCILFRMYEVRLTAEQLRMLLKDKDIALKCLGVLYVRFTQPIDDALSWVHDLVADETPVLIAPRGINNSVTATLSKFARNVFLEMKYLDTRFPRIPEKKLRDLRTGIDEECGRDDAGRLDPKRGRDADKRGSRGDDKQEEAPKRKRRLGRLGELDRGRDRDRDKDKEQASPREERRERDTDRYSRNRSRDARMRRGSSEDAERRSRTPPPR